MVCGYRGQGGGCPLRPSFVPEHSFGGLGSGIWGHEQAEYGIDPPIFIRDALALLPRSTTSRGEFQRVGRCQRGRKLLAARPRQGLGWKCGLRSRSKNTYRVEYRKTASLFSEWSGPRPSSGPVDPVGRWRLGCDRASAGVSTDLSPVVWIHLRVVPVESQRNDQRAFADRGSESIGSRCVFGASGGLVYGGTKARILIEFWNARRWYPREGSGWWE